MGQADGHPEPAARQDMDRRRARPTMTILIALVAIGAVGAAIAYLPGRVGQWTTPDLAPIADPGLDEGATPQAAWPITRDGRDLTVTLGDGTGTGAVRLSLIDESGHIAATDMIVDRDGLEEPPPAVTTTTDGQVWVTLTDWADTHRPWTLPWEEDSGDHPSDDTREEPPDGAVPGLPVSAADGHMVTVDCEEGSDGTDAQPCTVRSHELETGEQAWSEQLLASASSWGEGLGTQGAWRLPARPLLPTDGLLLPFDDRAHSGGVPRDWRSLLPVGPDSASPMAPEVDGPLPGGTVLPLADGRSRWIDPVTGPVGEGVAALPLSVGPGRGLVVTEDDQVARIGEDGSSEILDVPSPVAIEAGSEIAELVGTVPTVYARPLADVDILVSGNGLYRVLADGSVAPLDLGVPIGSLHALRVLGGSRLVLAHGDRIDVYDLISGTVTEGWSLEACLAPQQGHVSPQDVAVGADASIAVLCEADVGRGAPRAVRALQWTDTGERTVRSDVPGLSPDDVPRLTPLPGGGQVVSTSEKHDRWVIEPGP